MDKNNPVILVYITADKERVLSGDPLTLYITDENEKQECITELNRALNTDAVLLKNGDYMLITKK